MDYKDTVFLPKTNFSMRANLPQKEPELLKGWQEHNLYVQMQGVRKDAKPFILHDGPPYANGHIHLGTALNKIMKDIVNRSQHMLGFQVRYVPGWDCHGLPIEWKIEEKYRAAGKDKDGVPILQFRKECRDFAEHWINIQKEEFQRLGVVADWDNYYSSMRFESEAKIVGELGKFLMNGGLYKGEKPTLWSTVEKTALAEAEVEYHDIKSPSIYVRFPVASTSIEALKGASIVIWTTTPWTLPNNRAIAYGDEIDYALIEVTGVLEDSHAIQGENLLVAQELLGEFSQQTGIAEHKIIKTMVGADLSGTICVHPFSGQGYDFAVPLVSGHHVTTEAGTGLVHIGPGHGEDDFLIAKENDIEIPKTVGDDGVFYKTVPLFAGQHVFKVNSSIIEALQNAGKLLAVHEIMHSYPHSWRSKAPVIYRTTPQWFISMEKNNLREIAIGEIQNVRWIPAQGKNRIEAMVRDRPDWCISRQRAWGVPIPVFINKETGEPLRDQKVVDRIVDIIKREGSDSWFARDPQDFLGDDYKSEDFEQAKDVVDVWFEAGSTHAFVVEEREDLNWPVDLYLEGSDQHRGWFQSSLLEACGTRGKAPFKQVLTHGFVLDEKGYKMSKSLGNVIAPEKVADEMGIEILRLWVVASDFRQDVRIGKEILKYQQDTYRRFRNTLRYLLGGLSGYVHARDMVPVNEMPALEQWVLHRLCTLDREIRDAIDGYNLQEWFSILHNFCSVEISAFYFDTRKDVLYCDSENDIKRRAMRTVFHHLFECISTWLSPVLCFTADEAWKERFGETESVHLQKFPDIPAAWLNVDLEDKFEKLRQLRRSMTGALEVARAGDIIRSSLQAKLIVYDPKGLVPQDEDWEMLTITSAVEIKNNPVPEGAYVHADLADIGVVVAPADGEKCQRCWKITPEVGSHKAPFDDICTRCYGVVQNQES
jgi:isoleucyl-tRNA synthetase